MLDSKKAIIINTFIYSAHLAVAFATLFWVYETRSPVGVSPSYQLVYDIIKANPLVLIEFGFYLFVLLSLLTKQKYIKSLIHWNTAFIIIFLAVGTLTGYSMMLSYFFWIWATIAETTGIYTDHYFISMGSIALFYLLNALFIVPRINSSKKRSPGPDRPYANYNRHSY